MKKSILLLAGICSVVSFSQEEPSGLEPTPCGTTEHQEAQFEKHPEYKLLYEQEQAEFQLFYEEFAESYSAGDRELKIIPVVVHVIHTGGSENISDEQVRDAIKQMNEDFSQTNEDFSEVVPAFVDITGNMQIEFRLAGLDPDGNCTSGITRTFSEYTHGPHDGGLIRSLVESEHGNWPQNRYMNVFVCATLSGPAGYTNYPSSWYSPTGMGGSIYMLHNYMGSIGTSNEYREHTLSHEAGHWLNLPHLWGNSNTPADPDNCSSDDGVGDTPNTLGWTSCNLSGTTCGSLDNVQNFLEYSYCGCMFTEGQVIRSQAALNSSTAQRNNLWTPENLELTGTTGILCQASFESEATVVCVGSSVEYKDASYHQVTSRNWSFEGGTPSTSTAENPVITYSTPGTYEVSLQVWNGAESESITKTNYISVFDTSGTDIPYFEGFESIETLFDDNRFAVYNENQGTTWEITDEAAYLSGHSVWLDNFGTDDGSRDELISETIDLSSMDPSESMIFSFDYSYNMRNSSDEEQLRVYISNDCGEVWTLRAVLDSDDMTETVKTTPYIAIWDDWFQKEVITTITAPYYVENFMYKFEFTNDNGNNIFLDNIRLFPSALAEVEELETEEFRIYPNPATSSISMLVNGFETKEIRIYDTMGRLVSAQEFEEELSVEDLSNGLYHIQLIGDDGAILATERFMKK